jgi:hypothetical protein
VGDAAGHDEVVVVGRRELQVAVADASLDVAGGSPRPDVEVGELAARLKARIDEDLIGGHDLQRTDELVTATRLGPARALNPGQAEQVIGDDRLASGGVVRQGWLWAEVVPAERHDIAMAQPEALVERVCADVDQRAAGGGVAMLVAVHAGGSGLGVAGPCVRGMSLMPSLRRAVRSVLPSRAGRGRVAGVRQGG